MTTTVDRDHNVAVRVGGRLIEKWSEYSIDVDMLTPADGFQLSLGRADREAFELAAPDAAVQVLVDDIPIVSGFVDDREWSDSRDGGATLSISGRDKAGRLADESMPLGTFEGVTLIELAGRAAGPWFSAIVLSNADNRLLMRGRKASKAAVRREPLVDGTRKASRKVEPGESRWQVLAHWLEEAEYLAWSQADGDALVIGLPCYEQSPQFHFFVPGPGSSRSRLGNVKDCRIRHSVGERYSVITACGSGRADSTNYGPGVTKHRAVAKNNSATVDGTGRDFQHRKHLVISDSDIKSADRATVRARREMAERDATGHEVHVLVRGHAQLRDGRVPALFAPDCVARFEHEASGVKGDYLITAVTFTSDRQNGEQSRLRLVPSGTTLRI